MNAQSCIGELQDRTTDSNSRGTKKKFCERLSEVLASRTQENKTMVSYVMLGNFYSIKVCFFSYVYDFTDINECKGNHSCHVNASCMNTLGSHVCQCHAGYTGNGQKCTGKFHDRTDNACTVSTSRCSIQSLRKVF